MPDFFKKCHSNSKKSLVYFKQNVQTLTLYDHIKNRWYLIKSISCYRWWNWSIFSILHLQVRRRRHLGWAIERVTRWPPIPFYSLVLVPHVTKTDNLHTQVTQQKYTTNTSNTTHKQSKQTENNHNCETLGLFILLSAEIWITVMRNDWKCLQFFFKKKRKKMLVFPKNAEKNASTIEKGLNATGHKWV